METEKPSHQASPYGRSTPPACANYDRWPAGLENRSERLHRGSWTTSSSRSSWCRGRRRSVRPGRHAAARGFDPSCPAMAQGATRRARGEAYVRAFHTRTDGREAAVQIVPECGHNDRCVSASTTDAVPPVALPRLAVNSPPPVVEFQFCRYRSVSSTTGPRQPVLAFVVAGITPQRRSRIAGRGESTARAASPQAAPRRRRRMHRCTTEVQAVEVSGAADRIDR